MTRKQNQFKLRYFFPLCLTILYLNVQTNFYLVSKHSRVFYVEVIRLIFYLINIYPNYVLEKKSRAIHS